MRGERAARKAGLNVSRMAAAIWEKMDRAARLQWLDDNIHKASEVGGFWCNDQFIDLPSKIQRKFARQVRNAILRGDLT